MTIASKKFPAGSAVNYDKFRDSIEPGDILLCSGSGWFSKMIQKGTKKPTAKHPTHLGPAPHGAPYSLNGRRTLKTIAPDGTTTHNTQTL